jgi:hypothetical protein
MLTPLTPACLQRHPSLIVTSFSDPCRQVPEVAWEGGLNQLNLCLRLYLSMLRLGGTDPDHAATLTELVQRHPIDQPLVLRDGVQLYERKGDIYTSPKVGKTGYPSSRHSCEGYLQIPEITNNRVPTYLHLHLHLHVCLYVHTNPSAKSTKGVYITQVTLIRR